jgi:flagellar assembly protein FliH
MDTDTMKTVGRIPAEEISDARLWKLPSLDGVGRKFKVQQQKAARFSPEERQAHNEDEPAPAVESTPGVEPVQTHAEESDPYPVDSVDSQTVSDSNESGSVSDEVGSGETLIASADGAIPNEEIERESGPVQLDGAEMQTDSDEATSVLSADAYQKAKEEGFEAGRVEGRVAGLHEGIEQGKQKYEDDVKQKISNLDSLINQLRNPMTHNGDELSESIARLVMEISRRVVLKELQLDQKQIVNVVRKALDALPHGANSIRIFLAPEDIEVIEHMAQVSSGTWHLTEDASLSSGGCRIETSTSFVDYTLEKRFNDCLDVAFGADSRLHDFPAEPEEPVQQDKPAAFTGYSTASVSSSPPPVSGDHLEDEA